MSVEGITSTVSSVVVSNTNYTNVSTKPVTNIENNDMSAQTGANNVGVADTYAVNRHARNVGNENPSNEDRDQKNGKQPSERTIKQAVSDINRKLNNNTIAEFGYHEDTKRVTIKIVNKDTKEVVKEIPPEKTLDMIAKAWELAGILVDERK